MSAAGEPWRMASTRSVYKNEWFSVREDKVVRPDGSNGTYGVVEMPPYAGIVAIDSDGLVATVRQWRYITGRLSLEIPAGNMAPSDADILEAAKRELAEEAGLSAGFWTPLGRIDYSAVSNPGYLFLAQGLSRAVRPSNVDDWTELSWLPYFDVISAILKGEITESTSVAAVLMAEAARKAARWSL